MIKYYKQRQLLFITIVYWFLLLYMVAALTWWFISLEQQNKQMFHFREIQLNKDDPAYEQQLEEIRELRDRKTVQYIGEVLGFLLIILIGAVFVYRATRKQIKLSHQQQNFMMAVTHELKTPIAIARLNLETLRKRKLDAEQEQILIANTLQETDRLNMLCNNILISSQLESGAYSLNRQELDFSSLTEECIRNFNRQFPKRTINQDVEKDIFIEGEYFLLQMMLNNLVENALKYSPEDKPIMVRLSGKKNMARLSVIDEGLGINNQDKKKIFEKFYRTGDENTRRTKGTGLGLFLCRKIAEDHKGYIELKDNSPKGSIFTVVIKQSNHE